MNNRLGLILSSLLLSAMLSFSAHAEQWKEAYHVQDGIVYLRLDGLSSVGCDTFMGKDCVLSYWTKLLITPSSALAHMSAIASHDLHLQSTISEVRYFKTVSCFPRSESMTCTKITEFYDENGNLLDRSTPKQAECHPTPKNDLGYGFCDFKALSDLSKLLNTSKK